MPTAANTKPKKRSNTRRSRCRTPRQGDESLDDLARWLIAHAVKADGVIARASRALFHEMLEASDGPERAAAESALSWEGDAESVASWLAVQILLLPARMPKVKAAKTCLNCLLQSNSLDRRAAEHALIWMVLHTRPVKLLSREQRRTLLAEPDDEATDWAALVLDNDVIRPLLKQGRWWQRCRLAERKFGFDFADEGINFVWERIEKYRDSGRGFQGWLETVLGNYWNSLHRKWKREVPKDSDAAKELESLADGDGQPWKWAGKKIASDQTAEKPTHHTPHTGPSASLSDSDLAVIKHWEPIDGLLMGFEADLWQRIPPELWNRWLDRLKVDRWGLDQSIRRTKPTERRTLLTRLTGIKRNTLTQRWRRLKPKLAKLQCVAAVLTTPDDTH